MLTMVLVLGFSAICSASNGKVLDSEEAMVNKFLAASNYSAVTSMMTDDMKKFLKISKSRWIKTLELSVKNV